MAQVIWLSPLTDCNICHAEFDGSGPMFDAAISGGPWGNVCQSCFDSHGCRLGLGLGQKYELQTLDNDKRAWVKVAG